MNPYMAASGVVVNLEGLRRDMRANAFEYLARAYAGQPVPAIARIINGNAAGYISRIRDWYQNDRKDSLKSDAMARGLAVDGSIAKVAFALATDAGASISAPDAADPLTVLSKYDGMAQQCFAAAKAEAAAVIATYDDVVATANATLAAMPLAY